MAKIILKIVANITIVLLALTVVGLPISVMIALQLAQLEELEKI